MTNGHFSGSGRLGLGEFADPWGLVPLFMGRMQYLEALTTEWPPSVEELTRIMALVARAYSVHDRTMQELASDEPVPATVSYDPEQVRAALQPLADVLGINLPSVGAQPGTTGTPYRSPQTEAPTMVALQDELQRAFRRLGKWMDRWGFPSRDLSWCAFIAIWAFVIAGELPSDAPLETEQDMALSDAEASTFALLDREQLEPVFERVRFWLGQMPLPRDGDFTAFGTWIAGVVEQAIGRAAPVELPAMTWNPLVESRSAAEARMRNEAEQRIKEQLNATESRLSEAGADRTPVKTTGLDHFRWLVLYQVNRKSHQKIADEVFRERQAVRKAVNETAQLISLPLRDPTRPGRPRLKPQRAALT
jgi:hypothetical protein